LTRKQLDDEQITDQGPARALIYLRVSTKEQASTGGGAEGFSIPAQRDACRRKAGSLGAVVIDEFIDAGESARSKNRPELQRMLKYVEGESVDLVIVHKVDRLARNRADDVEISLALKNAGVTLVSCTENIDETPSGALLHGIMSSIAEFYSRNLANEVMKGLKQKAKTGGTPGRVPPGYANVIQREAGRELRTVETDPERAPMVRWAFETYARGEHTLVQLTDELDAMGMTSLPTANPWRNSVVSVNGQPDAAQPVLHRHRQLPRRAVRRHTRTIGVEGDLVSRPGGTRRPQRRRETPAASALLEGLDLLRQVRQPFVL
jgi:DNA invertase Pin-like site-specific DNA recombinase